MIKEYDIIESIKDLNDMISKGCKGTVLVIYLDPVAFEVEFIDDNFETLDVLTVPADEIRKIGVS